MEDDEHKYKRDSRSPPPKSALVSQVMSKIKSKNTKPELTLRKALYDSGLRGYRLNYNRLPGKPDIVFTKKRIAIFVNGCYWHRCEDCNPHMPINNVEFWGNKFRVNVERDKRKINELETNNWKVITIWECKIKTDLESCVILISEELRNV